MTPRPEADPWRSAQSAILSTYRIEPRLGGREGSGWPHGTLARQAGLSRYWTKWPIVRGAVAAGVTDQPATRDVDGRIGRATWDVDTTQADGACAVPSPSRSPRPPSPAPGLAHRVQGRTKGFRGSWARLLRQGCDRAREGTAHIPSPRCGAQVARRVRAGGQADACGSAGRPRCLAAVASVWVGDVGSRTIEQSAAVDRPEGSEVR